MAHQLKSSILLIFILAISLFAQRRLYNIIQLSPELENATIYCMEQDNDGTLIIGTDDGIYYYDGETFFKEKSDVIKDSTIISLYVDNNGILFAGTVSGVLVHDSAKAFRFYPLKSMVFGFYELMDKILILTTNGIYQYQNANISRIDDFNFLNGKRIYDALYFNGNFYFATNNGLLKYLRKENKFDILYHKPVFGLLKDKWNTIWISATDGIYTYKNDKLKIFSNSIVGNNRFSVLVYNKRCDLLVINSPAIKNGKVINGENRLLTIDKNRQLKNAFAPINPDGVIFFDYDGNLWVSSFKTSLIKYSNLSIELFERHYGVKSSVFGLCRLNDGTILAGTDGQGILKLENDKFVNFSDKRFSTVWKIKQDNSGRIWITSDKGLFYMDADKKLHELKGPNGKSFPFVSEISFDNNGSVIFALRNFIYQFKEGKISKLPIKLNTGINIYTILFNYNNDYLICTQNGILKYNGKETFNAKIDTSNVKDIQNLTFYGFIKSSDGKLVVPTNGGVIILDEIKKDSSVTARIITRKEGLVSNIVYNVIFDNNDNLWIETAKGLSVLDYKKYIQTGIVRLTNFAEGDAQLGMEYNQFSGLKDENSVWLGGTFGILHIPEPSEILFSKRIQKPYVKEIWILTSSGSKLYYTADKPADNINKLSLNYNENNLLIVLSAISFTNRTQLTYNFKFIKDNSESNLTYWSKGNKIFALELPSGNISLSISSKDQFFNTATNRNVLNLRISLPFWKTKFFFLLIVLTIATIVLLFFVYRERLHRINDRKLRGLINEKEKIAEELHIASTEYKNLFENAFSPMIILSTEENSVLDANDAACKLFNYNLNEIRKLDFKNIFKMSEKEFIKQTVLFRKTKIQYYKFFSKMKKKDNSIFEAEINAKMINYKGKNAYLLVIRDITKEKETEENLKRSIEEKNKAEKLKSNFLAQMSHEIRTPLNSILNNVTYLKEEIVVSNEEEIEDFHSAIGSIVRSGRRIIRTVETMLIKSQLDANAYEYFFAKLNLVEILSEIISEYEEISEFQNVEISFEYTKKRIWIFGDEFSIRQIFLNIIDNAVKYTVDGSIKIKIWDDELTVVVEVADTGIGIEKKYLERIFEPFSQEDERGYKRRFEGTGLGLSVVKSFCDLNKCKIDISSEKGKGTKVTLVFFKNSNLKT